MYKCKNLRIHNNFTNIKNGKIIKKKINMKNPMKNSYVLMLDKTN